MGDGRWEMGDGGWEMGVSMLGFILLLGALNRRETRRARIRNPTYRSTKLTTLAHRSNHTQESLRGGVPPFNGGAGGRNPQIRVLPPPEKSKPTNI